MSPITMRIALSKLEKERDKLVREKKKLENLLKFDNRKYYRIIKRLGEINEELKHLKKTGP